MNKTGLIAAACIVVALVAGYALGARGNGRFHVTYSSTGQTWLKVDTRTGDTWAGDPSGWFRLKGTDDVAELFAK
jgi:hypothetical protein